MQRFFIFQVKYGQNLILSQLSNLILSHTFQPLQGFFNDLSLTIFLRPMLFIWRGIVSKLHLLVSKRNLLLFHNGSLCHMKFNPLICSASQSTGLYMIETSVIKELNIVQTKRFHRFSN